MDLPASAPAHVNAVTLPPPSEVEYDNLAYFANASAKAFRFVRECVHLHVLLSLPFLRANASPFA